MQFFQTIHVLRLCLQLLYYSEHLLQSLEERLQVIQNPSPVLVTNPYLSFRLIQEAIALGVYVVL